MKTRNEIRDITADLTEIKRIIRKYCKRLYAKNLDDIDEMDNFLERQHTEIIQEKSEQKYNKRP